MPFRDNIEEIRDKLKCPICLGQLRDPRVLTCGHTFCFTCIQNDHRVSQLIGSTCPCCRKTYSVPENDVRNVCRNFTVNNVLEALPAARTSYFCLCQYCLAGDGIFICLKCKLNLCSECSWRETNNCCHERLFFQDLNSKPFLRTIVERSRSKQVCPSHPRNYARHFCQTCKRLLCNTCRLRDHIHHNPEEIHESVRKLREKDIPGLLREKIHQLRDTEISLTQERDRWHRRSDIDIQVDIQKYQTYQNECSVMQEEMCQLFQYGNDGAILELFHEREHNINEILSAPVHSYFWRFLNSLMYGILTVFGYIRPYLPILNG